MRITIKDDESMDICLRFPNWVLFNPPAAILLSRFFRRYHFSLNSRQIMTMAKALRIYKRRHPDWVFFEAEKTGDYFVQIQL